MKQQPHTRFAVSQWRGGFTLMELIIAIGIIGILASIVIVYVDPAGNIAKTRDVERDNAERELERAVYQYVIQNGFIPGVAFISTDPEEPTPICRLGQIQVQDGCVVWDELVTGNFVADIPVDSLEPEDSDVTGYVVHLTAVGRVDVTSVYYGVTGNE